MNEEDDLYESLPPSSTITTHMCAGALAGVGEHCVMYPFDCVKTRMQSLVPDPRANYRGVADALITIFRHEGIGNTVRGIGAVVGGAGPAHALYFACYEHLKKKFSSGEQGNHIAHGAAGCVATVLHDLFMNPADVIKQRMQMYGSPYRTCKECGISILKTEGPIAFYRSFTTQLSMNVPFQAVHFMTYEVTQDFLNPTRQYDPLTHGISGGVAGASAAIVTMPLDVCKTLLNTQEHCSRTNSISYVNGMRAAFQTVYEFQGIRGYFRGITARVFFQMPATAISWSIYEFFKAFLHREEDDSSRYLKVSSLQASSSK
ncbi:mitoferrin-2-like [Mercenaria mercenaria]|uniref:mitoferrin-2-like n=1 Tax=Mercenaria mercenaria TaxID=6596 RepID=UPI00234EFF81|nr:mitoferrin-2-like [Mercenaria mercenaria]